MSSPSLNWDKRVGSIVDGWLFPAEGTLPEALIVPLENPHLHQHGAWSALCGGPVAEFGVVSVHDPGSGCPVGVAKPVLGGAATAMLIDAAIRRGVRQVVGVGFCGGTQPWLRCGDRVIATAARADDGVAVRYLPGDTPGCSPVSVNAPGALAGHDVLSGHRGEVHSVAAVHLEDDPLVESCRSGGVLGLDMETATLYAVATARGAQAVVLLTVSDIPVTGSPTDARALAAGARATERQALDLVIAAHHGRS